MEEKIRKLQYYVIICNQKNKDKYISLLKDMGAHGINVIYGKGSAKAGLITQAFGLDTEEHKAVVSSLISKEAAIKLTELLYNDYGFSKPNTGIAFSFPIEGLTF